MFIELPTEKLINEYLIKFSKEERYTDANMAISDLYGRYPLNDNIESVLLKLSVLNDLYSTNIFGTYRLAKHILSINIDSYLSNGNESAVIKIATGHNIKNKNGTEINFYSFATKYCHWHNRDEYPIYDSFVDKVLWCYQKEFKFSNIRKLFR